MPKKINFGKQVLCELFFGHVDLHYYLYLSSRALLIFMCNSIYCRSAS